MVTTDGKNLYVSDTNNHEIRKIVISTEVVSTLAGSPISSQSTFGEPWGITTDGTSIYFADNNMNFIRKID
jgi:DNA-binding beta-propeller fold protein YncE